MDDIVLAYVEWREESTAVWDAYARWTSASAEHNGSADAAYREALNREEAAAKSYADLIELARGRLSAAFDLPPLPRDSD